MTKKAPYFMPIIRILLYIGVSYILIFATSSSLLEISKWWTLIAVVVNILTILILDIVLRRNGKSYLKLIKQYCVEENWKTLLITILVMSVIGIIGMILSGVLIYGDVPTILIQELPISLSLINVIAFPITIVLAELPLYFGYTMVEIEKSTNSKKFAMIYTIFFYALQHSFMPVIFEPDYMLFRFVSFLPLLLIITPLFERKRILYSIMIGHFILDFGLTLQILFLSVS